MTTDMKNILTSICLALFIISASITITLNFRPLYYHDISALKIEETSGFSKNIIKKNYDNLIDYNQFFYSGRLKLTMPMSEEGQIHFADVKKIFDTVEILCIITLILSVFLIKKQITQHDFEFLKLSSIITILLPSIAGIFTAVNWESTFIMFHKIMFRNDYWLFDEATDPVITILPDDFFLHCAIMIIVLILISSLLCIAFRSFFRHRFML
jgi:integral membrane protein (TIGR01906 family)